VNREFVHHIGRNLRIFNLRDIGHRSVRNANVRLALQSVKEMPVKRTRMLKMWNRGFLVFWKILLVGWQCRIYIVAHSYYMMVVHRIYHMVTTMIISPWYLKNRRKKH
jgi:hypothetical protein